MARTMTLTDGTEWALKLCGEVEEDGTLNFVPLDAPPLKELVALLCDPAVTGHIVVRGTETEDVYEGFTELVFLSTLIYRDGPYITLRKGATG